MLENLSYLILTELFDEFLTHFALKQVCISYKKLGNKLAITTHRSSCPGSTKLAPRQISSSHKSVDLSHNIKKLPVFRHLLSSIDFYKLTLNNNMSKKEEDNAADGNRPEDGAGTSETRAKVPHGAGLASSSGGTRLYKSEPIHTEIIDVDGYVDDLAKDMDEEQKRKCEMLKWIVKKQNEDRRNFRNNDLLVAGGLAAEMPSSLIPNFAGKAHAWAERVENILRAKGVYNLDEEVVTTAFLPIILSRLPPDIARDAPQGDLGEVLAYLKNVDKVRYDLNQCFLEGRKLEKSPSQAFNALVNRTRRALPAMDEEGYPDPEGAACEGRHIKSVAWTSLKAGLPSSLLALATALGIRYFPTPHHLEILDEAWADLNAAKEVPSVFSIKKQENTEVDNAQNKQLANFSSRLNQHAARMQQIEQHLNAEAASVSNITGNNNPRGMNNPRGGYNQRGGYYPRGGYNQRGNSMQQSSYRQTQPFRGRYNAGQNINTTEQRESRQRTNMQYNPRFQQPQTFNTQRNSVSPNRQIVQRTRSEGGNDGRFPPAVFPHRTDFCFYHRTFGKDARKHEYPCAWVFPSGNR